ncbi:MAG: hypothetical protein RL216_2539 [Pseudomonadota bacterium]|jgi:uncharacterized membrane protein YgcG
MARKVISLVFAGLVAATSAHAEGYDDSMVAELRSQGFTEIVTERTWLGRTKIVATGPQGTREIVINPNNGEILRAIWLIRQDGSDSGLVRSRGRGDDGDDADDDRDDDDDNGGSSGSGRGGSGSGSDSGSGGGDNGDDSE